MGIGSCVIYLDWGYNLPYRDLIIRVKSERWTIDYLLVSIVCINDGSSSAAFSPFIELVDENNDEIIWYSVGKWQSGI